MTVTLRQVAEKSGYSVKSVSRVVNNQGEISEGARQHILSVIKELNYRPNAIARGLVSGKVATVALVIPQITDPFFPEVMLGVEAVARQSDYNVFLCNTNDDPDEELRQIEILEGKLVEGIILCGSRMSPSQLEGVAKRHRVVILSTRSPDGYAVINIPGEAGFRETTSHLLNLGHRRIGHIGLGSGEANKRLAGFLGAMADAGLSVPPEWVTLIPKVTIESSYRAARQLLQQAPEITGLTCYNDLAAIGALRACKELGRNVPDDLAIVGFDDIFVASLVSPALTTVHVPRYELGQRAMQLLLQVIGSDGKLNQQVDVSLRMVIRESCGAQRGGLRPRSENS